MLIASYERWRDLKLRDLSEDNPLIDCKERYCAMTRKDYLGIAGHFVSEIRQQSGQRVA